LGQNKLDATAFSTGLVGQQQAWLGEWITVMELN
jgi:hypothetical protein